MSTRNFARIFVLTGSAFLAACQSGGLNDRGAAGPQGDAEPIRESELRAYCPSITLQEGTASFRTYAGSSRGDPASVVYQASINDTTRTCDYDASSITAAIAGKVVPGPRGRTGTITMPIRIVALRGDEVIYSRLYQHSVTISDTAGATQFVFSDPGVVIPGGIDRSVKLLAGFDEGAG